MPPEIKNDQALDLKKRARRRLVGAIALVLLMMMILPVILKDRALPEPPKEEIKISMPEALEPTVNGANDNSPTTTDIATLPTPVISEPAANSSPSASPLPYESVATPSESAPAEVIIKHTETKPVVVKPQEEKSIDVKPAEEKKLESKPNEDKSAKGDFTIQIGVYSDSANVAQLQAKLKAAGFASRTEKVTTPKGEKIRLRVGKYSSRQEAADALTNLNSLGMTGMVITNK